MEGWGIQQAAKAVPHLLRDDTSEKVKNNSHTPKCLKLFYNTAHLIFTVFSTRQYEVIDWIPVHLQYNPIMSLPLERNNFMSTQHDGAIYTWLLPVASTTRVEICIYSCQTVLTELTLFIMYSHVVPATCSTFCTLCAHSTHQMETHINVCTFCVYLCPLYVELFVTPLSFGIAVQDIDQPVFNLSQWMHVWW